MKISWLVLTGVLLGGCGGSQGLQLAMIDASVQKPSNVAVYFTVDTADGEPVIGLKAEDFRIYEDGKLVSVHESQQTILNPEVASAHYTLLLVDMSGSVTESDDIPTIVAAASAFADRVGKYQHIAVYAFDGGADINRLVGFSNNAGRIQRGIERLDGFRSRDPSTNLNGAVVKALSTLDGQLRRSNQPLRFGTLVVFTDGSDRAARVGREQMDEALDATEHEVYVIGVGSEIDEGELRAIGLTEAILTTDREAITGAFEQAAARIEAMSQRYYLLGYCSPARAGTHEVTVEASHGGHSGSLSYEFNADGFRPNCDPEKAPSFDVRRPKVVASP
jgi:hypothetical protein